MTADPAKDAERLADPHPWYGPCDMLGPNNACVECLKLIARITQERDSMRALLDTVYECERQLRGERDEARRSAEAMRADAIEACAQIADSFTCGGCGMGGKAGAAIRALGKIPVPTCKDNLQVATQPSAADVERARAALFRAAGWHYTPDLSTFTPFERSVWEAATNALTAARREERELREAVAKALSIADGVSERFWQQEGSAPCWQTYLEQADAALAAIEASGTHVLAEVEPVALERVVKADFLRWCVYGGYTDDAKLAEWYRMRNIELERFRRRYRAMIAARPRGVAPTEQSDD